MSLAASFSTPDAARTALLAGNATITLVSKKTGTRYTFNLKAPKDGGDVRFVSLLTGPNNETDYNYIGLLTLNGFRTTAKSKLTADAAPCKAIGWTYGQLAAGVLPETVEVWHEGRCCRCGRKLTVPESVANGIGPDCAEKMMGGA